MKIRITLIGLAILLISGLTTLSYFQQKKISQLSEERQELIQVTHDSARIAVTYINAFGQKVSENKVLKLSLRNTKALMDTKELAFLKQLEGVKKNGKNLDAAVRIDAGIKQELTLSTSDTMVLLPSRSGDGSLDSLVGRSFSYHDPFNSISGITIGDSTTLKASITVPLSGAVYWKRKHKFIFKNWRWGKKEYFSELTSENPWVEIINHEFIKVEKR